MGRLFGAPRPIPAALALATLPFLFDASFTIDGGNLFSTMAGEYAFSLSLARRWSPSASSRAACARARATGSPRLALSVTLAAHVLPWLFAIGAISVTAVFEVFQRLGHGDPRDHLVRGDLARPVRFAVGAGLISIGFSAWWLFSFATTQKLHELDGLHQRPPSTLHQIFTTLGWFTSSGGAAGDRWVIFGAALSCVAAFVVRDRLGMILATLTVLSFCAFVFDPQSVDLERAPRAPSGSSRST